MTEDTVVALSSGQGPAGVAVIRASGPEVRFGLETVVGDLPPARKAVLRALRAEDGTILDRGLVLFFPAPNSFTGEDSAEFQVHGGPAIIAALLDRLTALPGWRLADRGEFTRRAVANGRLDLTAAEAIADLVSAETQAQRKQAVAGAAGALGALSIRWRNDLLDASALIEAEIDFPDEGDVPLLQPQVRTLVAETAESMRLALAGARKGERLREGAVIVLAGPPNAGKSTLLNALARRDVAIVSPIAGTTRDAIEVRLDLDGYPATLIDTAGLRESDDPLERIGIERSMARIADADLVVWLSPLGEEGASPPDKALIVRSKADRATPGSLLPDEFAVSAVTGEGLDSLIERLASAARTALAGGESALVTRARQRSEIETALAHLERVLAGSFDSAPELLAEELRLALRAIGRLTGSVDIDEIYDRIFSQFCIGK